MRSLGLALVKFLVSGLLFSLFDINYMHDLYLRESFYPQFASSLSHYLEPLSLFLFVNLCLLSFFCSSFFDFLLLFSFIVPNGCWSFASRHTKTLIQ